MPISTALAGVTATADDPREGMTLDEIAAFVDAARDAGVPGSTIPTVTSTWRQSAKTISIDADRAEGHRRRQERRAASQSHARPREATEGVVTDALYSPSRGLTEEGEKGDLSG
jgi:hypothetical protein